VYNIVLYTFGEEKKNYTPQTQQKINYTRKKL
jgi:hypothetical protein